MDLIGHETAIDDLRQLALETAESFTRRLVLGELALVMVSTEPRMHGLNAGGEVERGVERPVAEDLYHFTLSGKVPIDRCAVGVPFTDKTNVGRFGHSDDRRCRGNVWFVPYETVRNHAGKHGHPAIFPDTLADYCLRLAGVRPDDVVLDPFAGSGTVGAAASRLGVRSISIELDPSYAATAWKRLSDAVPDGALPVVGVPETGKLEAGEDGRHPEACSNALRPAGLRRSSRGLTGTVGVLRKRNRRRAGEASRLNLPTLPVRPLAA